MLRLAAMALLAATLLVSGCATYGERVAPVPLPANQPGSVVLDGAGLLARGYADPRAARAAFGFDIRGAGLLPVQFVIDNGSGRKVAILPSETLLIDAEGNAWPLLQSDRAAERIRTSVAAGESIRGGARASLLTGLAGAVAGAAVGIVSGESVGEAAGKGAAAGAAIGALGGGAARYGQVGQDIRQDLAENSIQDRVIREGELAYGFLFFPGAGEAQSAQSLRLGLRIGDETRVVTLPVIPAQAPQR
jgi:hypothetical protein